MQILNTVLRYKINYQFLPTNLFVIFVLSKTHNVRNIILLFGLIIYPTLFYGQEVKTIKLKSKKQLYSPVNYYVETVVDDRQDTTNIGKMRSGMLNRSVLVNLEYGAAAAISNLLATNTHSNSNSRHVQMHITRLEVVEQNVGMRQQAEVFIGVAFHEKGDKLIEYTGSANVQTGLDASAYISQLVINNIEHCLESFDKRMAAHNAITDVIANVKIDVTSTDKELIPFTRDAKLTYGDFMGEPDDLSIASALTYSGISMKYQHGEQNGHIQLNVTLSAYFDKTKSWCRQSGKSEKMLNHELLHFQVTALNTCKLARAIKEYKFSTDNYEKELSELLKEADKEGARLQNQYDKETTHGIKATEQLKWDKEIRSQLDANNCF